MSQYIIVNGELYHHGVKGMKWGIRKKIEQVDDAVRNKITDMGNRHLANRKKLKDSRYRSTLTNEELKRNIQRLRDEKELRELTDAQIHPGRTAAKKMLGQIGTQVVTKVAVTALTGAALYGLSTNISGQKADFGALADAMFRGGAKKK